MKVIKIIFPAENNQAILTFDRIDASSLIIAQHSELTGAECFIAEGQPFTMEELIREGLAIKVENNEAS